MLRLEVEWIDSGESLANDEWTPTFKLIEKSRDLIDAPVVSVGHLAHVTPDTIVLGLNYDEKNDTWFSAQVIERRSIRKVTVLRARQELAQEALDKLA